MDNSTEDAGTVRYQLKNVPPTNLFGDKQNHIEQCKHAPKPKKKVLWIIILCLCLFVGGFCYGDSVGYERAKDEWYHYGYKDGEKAGYSKGKTAGYNSGYTKGYNTGYSNGYNAGYEDAQPSYSYTPYVDYTVYITATGSKYHRWGCQYLRSSCYSISLTDAIASGYTACSVCSP